MHEVAQAKAYATQAKVSATYFFWLSATYFFWLHVQRKLCVHTILYDYILYVYVSIPEAE